MRFDLGVNGFDLFFGTLDGDGAADLAGHPDGEKDRVNAALFHARNIDASLFVARGEIEVAVDEPLCGVGVGVDDDGGEMKLAGLGGDFDWRGLTRHCDGAEDKN